MDDLDLRGDEPALDELLSRPPARLIDSLAAADGDIMVLGVGGKMGPTLAVMARRALDACGSRARVIGVARFSDPGVAERLRGHGVDTISCDLLDREAAGALPDAQNVIFMAGQKFGTTQAPERTWAMNALAPAIAADRFRGARTVVFSTGCVYPNMPVDTGGAVEESPLEPVGEYANSCVARERLFTYVAALHGSPVLHFRLNYAIDLRYGVLHDIALKVASGAPIDLTTGHVNVIWQGDACAWAIECLRLASSPAVALNATGPETLSVRALANRFGKLFGKEPVFIGTEAPTALLSNASRACGLFGPPAMPVDTMAALVANWILAGGRSLSRPTHFETRDGKY